MDSPWDPPERNWPYRHLTHRRTENAPSLQRAHFLSTERRGQFRKLGQWLEVRGHEVLNFTILTTFLKIHLQMEPWGMNRFNLWEVQCESLHPYALIQPKTEPEPPHSINCQNAAAEQRSRHMWNVIGASKNLGLALSHQWWEQARFQVNSPETQMETPSLDGCHSDPRLLPYPDFFIFSFVFRLFSFSGYI